MGGSKSQTVKQFFDMQATNRNITNQITTNAVKVGAVPDIDQQIENRDPRFGNWLRYQDESENRRQTAVHRGSSDSEIIDMKKEIQNSMQQAASSNMEMLTELGSLSDVIGKSDQNIEQHINTVVENVDGNEHHNREYHGTHDRAGEHQQSGTDYWWEFDCRGGRGTIDLNQDITAQLSASAVTNMITEKILEDKMVNDLAAKAEASVKQENTGFAGIIDSDSEEPRMSSAPGGT